MKNNHIKGDLSASIVVFLVAVPLCLGIALASGVPLISGLIAGILGGIITGLISKSSLGVSGPAAGLIVIVIGALQSLESFPLFLMAVLISGAIQIILGIAKIGIIGYYFPTSVIKGMLSAIGITIILKQIPHAVGYDLDPEGEMEFFQRDGENTFSELYHMLEFIHYGAIIIFIVSMLILKVWEHKFFKQLKYFGWIKGPLVVVILGIVINSLFYGNETLYLNNSHLVTLPLVRSSSEFFSQFTVADFSGFFNKEVWIIAFTLAIVGSLETLLSVEATDKLDPQKRITPTNRELIAQGVGNICSGMIGGLPITQVVVRSSANIQSGGKTKLSTVLHGILILISVVLIPDLLNKIPLACLAAILITVGYKLANPSVFKKILFAGKEEFIPFVVTTVGIIFTDLLIGILLGLAVAIFEILLYNYKFSHEISEGDSNNIKIVLEEHLSFLNKAAFIHTISDIPENSHVFIDARNTKYMHSDVFEIIEDFKQNAKYRDITLEIIGLSSNQMNNRKI